MKTLIVNLSGLLLMAGIVWWFWLTKPSSGSQHKPPSGAGEEIEQP